MTETKEIVPGSVINVSKRKIFTKKPIKSSSFHKLSGDNPNFLNRILVRIFYFPLNWINNCCPMKNLDPNIKFSQFKIENFEKQYKSISPTASPSRKLSDLFWMNYDWRNLRAKLGKINMCDLGCGSGIYYEKIQKYSSRSITNYLGIDINENKKWIELKSQYQNINFMKYDGKNILRLIPDKTNLIISQSAIEHFSEDINVFRQLMDFIKRSKHPVCQIHLFPSSQSLKMYPFHGIRQYTPRTISKMTRLFSGYFSNIELFGLGGDECIKTHRKYFTTCKQKNGCTELDEIYFSECKISIEKDLQKQIDITKVNFYALLIE